MITAPLSAMLIDVAASAITAAITNPVIIVPQILFNGFIASYPLCAFQEFLAASRFRVAEE
jgi:hypothetical protein